MKFETVMFNTLFGACALICLLVMGAMFTSKATVPAIGSTQAPTAVVASRAG